MEGRSMIKLLWLALTPLFLVAILVHLALWAAQCDR